MIRSLVIAFVLFLATIAQANAQTNKVCDGRFERLLGGYMIGGGELTHFLGDRTAATACLKTLDRRNDDHLLIEAFVQMFRYPPDTNVATLLFDSLCHKGRRLACVAGFAHTTAGIVGKPVLSTEQIAILQASVSDDIPLVNTMLGASLLSHEASSEVERRRAVALLKRAVEQGDWWAPVYLARYAHNDPDRNENSQVVAERWRQRAADMGNLQYKFFIMNDQFLRGDAIAGFATALSLAQSNPTLFLHVIARARARVADSYDSGIGIQRDPAKARHWYEQSANLGLEYAKWRLKNRPP
jgi:hypothetical protein